MKVIIEARKPGEEPFLSDMIEGDYMRISSIMNALAQEGYTQQTAHRLDMVCDFCSEPKIAWRFEIEPGGFIGRVITDSTDAHHIDRDGLWGACAECANYIIAEDWDALSDRSIDHAISMFPEFAGMPDARVFIASAIVAGPHTCFRTGYEKTHPLPISVISDDELMGS
jgi:hypothetical protein